MDASSGESILCVRDHPLAVIGRVREASNSGDHLPLLHLLIAWESGQREQDREREKEPGRERESRRARAMMQMLLFPFRVYLKEYMEAVEAVEAVTVVL